MAPNHWVLKNTELVLNSCQPVDSRILAGFKKSLGGVPKLRASNDEFLFVAMLKESAAKEDLCTGMKLHASIVDKGLLERSPYVASSLINMYAKCGLLEEAQRLHDHLPQRSLILWNALISGYVQHGQEHKALICYEEMQSEGLSPNAVTFISSLKACGNIGSIDMGEKIHDEIAKRGSLLQNFVLGTALVSMYAKCGSLTKAEKLHDQLCFRDIVSWNVLIAGYVQHENGLQALSCYGKMQREGCIPNEITFTCVLKACGNAGVIEEGRKLHDEIIAKGLLEKNSVLGNVLVDMYVKCNMLAEAERVSAMLYVRDVVSWSALIAGYTEQRFYLDALNCFELMEREGISPNEVTFVSVLKACGNVRDIKKGKFIHNKIIGMGLLKKNTEIGNALIDMYVKCGMIQKAQEVLHCLHARTIVSWSALIAGFVECGQSHKALNCFEWMKKEGIAPDVVTFTFILKACSSIGAIDRGKQIHDEIVSKGLLGKDVMLGTALVDMYARCGMLVRAKQVLNELPIRNVVTWNALMTGYAQQGQSVETLNCFDLMQQEGLPPDAVSLLCVLNACSHSGLLDRSQMYFQDMSDKYNLTPNMEHYTCMVAIFASAGDFERAISIIKMMHPLHSSPVWLVLLSACRKWGYVKLGMMAFDQAIQLDDGSAPYVLMADVYEAAGMQEDAQRVEATRLKYATADKRLSKPDTSIPLKPFSGFRDEMGAEDILLGHSLLK